jgi:hypothetical protein
MTFRLRWWLGDHFSVISKVEVRRTIAGADHREVRNRREVLTQRDP